MIDRFVKEQTSTQAAIKIHPSFVCLFVCLSVCLGFNGTFSINRLYRVIKVGKYITYRQETTKIHNKTMKQYTKKIIRILLPGLSGDDPLATIRLPQRSLSSQSLGK